MRLALECPTSLLGDIQPLADFDFVLTHLVLQDEGYARYFRESSRFKILDNSTNELLHPCSLDEIEKAAEIVRPNYVIPPDYLGDHLATERSLDKAISRFGKDRIYPIIQGNKFGYAIECAKYILSREFDRLAVPYDICSQRGDRLEVMALKRRGVVDAIIGLVPIGFEIHLLGMTTLEELSQHNQGWVKSIDTGSPIMHGLRRVKLGRDRLLPKNMPTLDLMKEFTTGEYPKSEESLELVYYNIAYLRKIINDIG